MLHIFSQRLSFASDSTTELTKAQEIIPVAATPSPFFPLWLFHPHSHTTDMEPQHLRCLWSSKNQISSGDNHQLQPASLCGMGQDIKPTSQPHELSCEVRPDLQHRSELCAQVFQNKSSTPNMWNSPGSRNCLSRSSSKSGITHMTRGLSQHLPPHWYLPTGSLAVRYTVIFPHQQQHSMENTVHQAPLPLGTLLTFMDVKKKNGSWQVKTTAHHDNLPRV